jgi:hypothetical protein
MRYYAEILNDVIINIGTFTDTYHQTEEQIIIEITKEDFDNIEVGQTTIQELQGAAN